jgi:hypothetical protein
VKRFAFEDPDDLDRLLRDDLSDTRIVCMDGVNSITGNAPDLREFARVAREHGALLYVDDAHGFGVIGERGKNETSPYGLRGNSIVRHFGESYDGVVLVAGFSKAYSSLAAFIACPTELKELLKTAAPPYLYSGPSPVASLATVLAGFDVNEARGDQLRFALWRKTEAVLKRLAELDVYTPNHSGYPIIEVPLRRHEEIGEVGRFLFDRGVYVTLAAYPLVPKHEVGFRVQVTAANTDAEIERLTRVIGELAAAGRLRLRPTPRLSGRRRDRLARGGAHALAAERLGLVPGGRRARHAALHDGLARRRQRAGDERAQALVVRGDRPGHRAPPAELRKAWVFFLVGSSCSSSATSTYSPNVPFPSPGDALYLTVYPALMAGLVLLVRRRNPISDRAGLIDSLILSRASASCRGSSWSRRTST